ncbi:hydrogenase formation protein [Rhodoferax lacus]|uniref:Hydrogenase formation protein n=1 Tax=Rhodoferax lacus TaxID=2184758 RepID=A0A3E1R6A7_9BURK|nr:hydrogenase formation protein [Rhodoferax lacus]RFO94908.1 hydrogenase formation protein [Rhodoferax lacus]
MSPSDALAGKLRLSPGQARPHNLHSSRRDWAAAMTRGMAADGLAARLASIFSLCGESHRLCAQMAVAAARGTVRGDTAQAALTLQRETLQEHVRRITLDWPGQLLTHADAEEEEEAEADAQALSQQALVLLQQCPLFGLRGVAAGAPAVKAASTSPPQAAASTALSDLPLLQDWLHTQLLGMDAATWLARWEQDPASWLRHWSASKPLCVAQMLQRARPLLDQAGPQSPLLRVHSSDTSLLMLADDLQRDPGFTRRPLWRGRCAETGSWTRLSQSQPERLNTAWLRLGARLAELVRLALPDAPRRCGAHWLAMGSLPTAPRSGLAWIEMARGLLIHQVQLDASGSSVLSCQVLAPTEWNFHPQGAVAEALESMPAHAGNAVIRAIDGLLSAYDPCVQHELNTTASPTARESAHA